MKHQSMTQPMSMSPFQLSPASIPSPNYHTTMPAIISNSTSPQWAGTTVFPTTPVQNEQDGPLNLSKPKYERPEKHREEPSSFHTGLNRHEVVVTPPPAHSNHKRPFMPTVTHTETPSSFVSMRSPFGIPPQYLTSPYMNMAASHMPLSSVLSGMPPLMNSKPSPNDVDKVSIPAMMPL